MRIVQNLSSELKSNIKIIKKSPIVTVYIDKQKVADDYLRIKQLIDNSKHKKVDKEAIEIKDFLYKLGSSIQSDKTIDITWTSQNHKKSNEVPYSYPYNIIKSDKYNVNILKYVLSDNETFVHCDTSNIANLIAFELIYKDLGYTLEDIEEKLSSDTSYSLISDNEYCMLKKLTDEEDLYRLSQELLIDKSAYYKYETHKISDYFGVKQFKPDRYAEVTEFSAKYATSVILGEVMKMADKMDIQVLPLGVYADGTDFLIKGEYTDEDLQWVHSLLSSISARTFGRFFLMDVKANIVKTEKIKVGENNE